MNEKNVIYLENHGFWYMLLILFSNSTRACLTGNAAVIASQATISPQDLVAGHNDHDWVLVVSPNRFRIADGLGNLYVDKDHTTHLSETPDFPNDFKPLAAAMGEALDKLREHNDVNWTYLSPAADFQADGAKTGKYILGGEELTLNPAGESVISYADYAVAMVDEVEKGTHNKERISVVKA